MLEIYEQGRWAAGTAEERAEMQRCAIECWVFSMRRLGDRLPARKVAPPIRGWLLAFDRYGDGRERFYARLFRSPQLDDFHADLHGARVVRESGGCRTVSGDEFSEAHGRHFRQTWLCTPSAERGYEILTTMDARESGQE